mmetsp:Transcript_137587/g.343349  ORF Transcript_137587/g.343349 Transcript_137587/m.343349 type:complete len:407 (-) Transcript_137587:99-1319(-)
MAGMRVRNSPFGASGSAGAPGGPGQGLTGAPAPPARPAAAASPDINFDWMEGDDNMAGSPPAGSPPSSMRVQPPQMQGQGLPPRPNISPQQQVPGMAPPGHQFQQMPQQQFQQMPPQQQPQQMQPQQMMGQAMGQGGAALLAGGMGAMGVNPMMADVIGEKLIHSGVEQIQSSALLRWFPSIMMGMRELFCVGHSFVLRKLLLLMCPFIKGKEGAASSPWGDGASPGGGGNTSPTGGQLGPDGLKVDTEDADLYIPSMAYITYVLLYGVQRGIHKEFKPEILSSTFSFALVLFILEVGVFYMAFYFASSPIPVLQLVANCSYKYVQVVLMVLVRIITASNYIFYLCFAYLAACAAWAVRRFMTRLEPSQLRQQYGTPQSSMTKHVILAMAVTQIPVCWLLTPSSSG